MVDRGVDQPLAVGLPGRVTGFGDSGAVAVGAGHHRRVRPGPRTQDVRVVHLQDAVLLHDAEQQEYAEDRVNRQRLPQEDQR